MNLIELLSFFGAMNSADLLMATKMDPEELKEELESLLESEEVDLHITATGSRFWRIPGANELSAEKTERLLQIAGNLDSGFTPSSLHREQLLELGISREQVKALVDKWYHDSVLIAIGEKRVMGKNWTVYGVAGKAYVADDGLLEEVRDIIAERQPITGTALAKVLKRSRHKTQLILEQLIEKGSIGKEDGRYVTL